MSTIKEVTERTFQEEVLDSEKPVIVDFWAAWCGPCRAVSPIIDEIAQDYADKVTVAKIDVDENPSLAAQYGITSIPAVYVFKNGDVAARSLGAKPKAAFEQEFAEFLK